MGFPDQKKKIMVNPFKKKLQTLSTVSIQSVGFIEKLLHNF